MLSVIVAAVLTAGGTGSSPPAPAVSTDMVTAAFTASTPTPTHLGHWPAPLDGAPKVLTANASAAGSGAGSVTFGVLIEGTGTVCTLVVPCTLAPGDPVQAAVCPAATVSAGVNVHLEFSHTCAENSAPTGTLIGVFEWIR